MIISSTNEGIRVYEIQFFRVRHGRMVVRFTTNCNRYLSPLMCVPISLMVEVYSIQQYVINIISDLRQFRGFLRVLWFPPPKKNQTDSHDLIEILMKVSLNTITLRPNNLSLLCLYLLLYISFLLPYLDFFFFDTDVQIIKRKYIMTNIDTQETDYSVYITLTLTLQGQKFDEHVDIKFSVHNTFLE